MGWKVKGLNHSRAKLFSYKKYPDLLWGTPSLILSGFGVSFLGEKELECAVDHWRLSGAEVKNRWSFTSSPVHDVYTHSHTHTCACHIIGLLFLLGEETKYKVQRLA